MWNELNFHWFDGRIFIRACFVWKDELPPEFKAESVFYLNVNGWYFHLWDKLKVWVLLENPGFLLYWKKLKIQILTKSDVYIAQHRSTRHLKALILQFNATKFLLTFSQHLKPIISKGHSILVLWSCCIYLFSSPEHCATFVRNGFLIWRLENIFWDSRSGLMR